MNVKQLKELLKNDDASTTFIYKDEYDLSIEKITNKYNSNYEITLLDESKIETEVVVYENRPNFFKDKK
jgi:hypothetical protein